MVKPIHRGELVFAKIRGYPAWPAMVEVVPEPENSNKKNTKKYTVIFFGTNDRGLCSSVDLFPYVENKERYGKKRDGIRGFNKALTEIEACNAIISTKTQGEKAPQPKAPAAGVTVASTVTGTKNTAGKQSLFVERGSAGPSTDHDAERKLFSGEKVGGAVHIKKEKLIGEVKSAGKNPISGISKASALKKRNEISRSGQILKKIRLSVEEGGRPMTGLGPVGSKANEEEPSGPHQTPQVKPVHLKYIPDPLGRSSTGVPSGVQGEKAPQPKAPAAGVTVASTVTGTKNTAGKQSLFVERGSAGPSTDHDSERKLFSGEKVGGAVHIKKEKLIGEVKSAGKNPISGISKASALKKRDDLSRSGRILKKIRPSVKELGGPMTGLGPVGSKANEEEPSGPHKTPQVKPVHLKCIPDPLGRSSTGVPSGEQGEKAPQPKAPAAGVTVASTVTGTKNTAGKQSLFVERGSAGPSTDHDAERKLFSGEKVGGAVHIKKEGDILMEEKKRKCDDPMGGDLRRIEDDNATVVADEEGIDLYRPPLAIEDFLMEEKKRKFDDRGSGDFISEPFKGFITEVLEQDKGEGLISLPLADINQKINAPNLENLMVDEEVDLHEAVEDTCKIAEVEEAGKEVARVKEEVDVKEEDDKKRV